MTNKRYFSFFAFLVIVLPYGWGMPRYILLLLPVSIGAFFLARLSLLKFDLARGASQLKTAVYFAAAAAVMFGHTALIRAFIQK